MIRRIAFLLALAPSLAWGQSLQPPGFFITNDYTPTGAWTFQGTATFNNHVSVNQTIADPVAETQLGLVNAQYNLTTGNNSFAVLPWIVQMALNPGHFNYNNGEHTVAVYGHGFSNNTLTLAGCTGGVNCPGSIYSSAGVLGMADNEGTGAQANAYSFIIHSPSTPPTGGTLDHWFGMHDDGCFSGVNAGLCTGLDIGSQSRATYSGFGTSNPMAEVHASGSNKTATATGTITGTTLTLASVPTNEIYPGAAVSGTGVTAGTVITGVAAANATTGQLQYTVNNSQTVASTTLTFTDSFVGFITQNLTASGSARYAFISAGSGTAISSSFDGRFDSGVPLSFYIAANMNGADVAYFIPAGGARAGGMAIGYTTATGTPVAYNLTVAADINAGGKYYSNGTAGISCAAGVTAATVVVNNGIVTHC